MDKQTENSSKKLKNSVKSLNQEEFLKKYNTLIGNSGIMATPKTELPEPTNRFLVKFLKYPKKQESPLSDIPKE